jgi:hypothetical protein
LLATNLLSRRKPAAACSRIRSGLRSRSPMTL